MRAALPPVCFLVALSLSGGCGGDKTAASSSPAASSGPSATVAEDVPMPDEARAVYDQIVASQRAGYEEHDIDAYMAMWHPDATLVMALSPTPDQDYVSMTRAQVEATRRIRFCREPVPYKMKFELADAQMHKGDLIIDVRTGDAKGQEQVVERYTMRKHQGEWRIFENRYWIESLADGEGMMELNAERYQSARKSFVMLGDKQPMRSFQTAMDSIMWVEAAKYGAAALAQTPDLAQDKGFVNAYAIALLFNGEAVAAVKAYEGKLDMPDAEAQALIDGYCAAAK